MKLILLNGPPRSGKDTAASILYDYIGNCEDSETFWLPTKEKLSEPIKRAFCGLLELDLEADGNLPEPYNTDKEKVIPLLGVSARQWQIDFSEKFMKPLYGNDIFARLLWQSIDECEATKDSDEEWFYIVSDCGFQIEVDTLLHNCAPEDVLLIRLERAGCSFEDDSREYVTATSPVARAAIHNNGTLKDLETAVIETFTNFMKGAYRD